MKNFKPIIIAVLLVAIAAAGLEYMAGGHSLLALLLAPLVLTKSLVLKLGLNRIIMIVAIALVPVFFRRLPRRIMVIAKRRSRRIISRTIVRIKNIWEVVPVWISVFFTTMFAVIVIATMILSGSVLWLLAALPFIAKSSIGLYMIRYLATTAAGTGLRRLAPFLFSLLPDPIEKWIERRYLHLWWWTMRRIVKNRRRVEKKIRNRRRNKQAVA